MTDEKEKSYEQGILDGMVLGVNLINEGGDKYLRLAKKKNKSPTTDSLPPEEQGRVDGYYVSAKLLWGAYRSRLQKSLDKQRTEE